MKNIYKGLIFSLTCVMTAQANALCVQTGNSINLTGLDNSDGRVYANMLSSDNQCGCAFFRFSPQNTDIDAALSVLIAAKLANNTVRIDINSNNDCNSGFRVYLE